MTGLPAGWQLRCLSEIGHITLGQSPPSASYNTAGLGLPFFQGKAEFGDLYPDVRKYTTAGTKFAEPGDILLSVRAPVGPTNLAPTRCAIGRGLAAVRAGDAVDARYLLWALRALEDRLAAMGAGSTFAAVTAKQVRELQVPLAPRAEQTRIVEILEDHLSRLDAANDYLDAASRRLDSIEQVVLERLTSMGEVRPLAELAQVQGGIQKQAKRRPVRNTYPFLRVANVTSAGLDLTDVHEIELFDGELARYRLVEGDLLVVEGNGSPSQIGRAATWDGSIRDCVHQNHLIRVRPGAGLLPGYLESAWNAAGNRRALTAVASSTSGLYTLSVAKLQRLSLRVPPLEDQARVVEEVRAIRSARSALAHALAVGRQRSESLRRSLLAAAFSGRLTGRSSDLDLAEEMAFV